jgi:hypothetical protein
MIWHGINLRASPLHAAVIALVNSLLQAGPAFGVHVTGTQDVAVTSILNCVLVLLSVAFIQGTSAEAGKP